MGKLSMRIWDSVVGGKHPDDTAEIMQRANEFVDWTSKPQHQRFLDWLYDEADKPVPISGEQVNLIVGTARANTMKEIRRYLLSEESKANSLLEREQHG